MKTAYIIYYDKEAQKNSGFIEMLMTEFFKYDIVLEYVSYEVTAAMSGSESPDAESTSCFCSFSFALTRGKRWYIITKAERNHMRNRIQSKVPSILWIEYINWVITFIIVRVFLQKYKMIQER